MEQERLVLSRFIAQRRKRVLEMALGFLTVVGSAAKQELSFQPMSEQELADLTRRVRTEGILEGEAVQRIAAETAQERREEIPGLVELVSEALAELEVATISTHRLEDLCKEMSSAARGLFFAIAFTPEQASEMPAAARKFKRVLKAHQKWAEYLTTHDPEDAETARFAMRFRRVGILLERLTFELVLADRGEQSGS